LWGYRRGRLDFLIVLLHAAQVCVVFVHVRVAVCRALLTMASVMWRTQCAAERTDPRRARDASVRCQLSSCVGCGEYPLSCPSKSRISARDSANTRKPGPGRAKLPLFGIDIHTPIQKYMYKSCGFWRWIGDGIFTAAHAT